MNNYKSIIKREAAKRMISKDMDLDYIKEITGLAKKEIKNIDELKKSFIGDYDYKLRKEYASKVHLAHVYYFEEKTRYYTGTDIDKFEFYKNRLIMESGKSIKRDIESIKEFHENDIRLEAMFRVLNYMKDTEDLINALKIPNPWPEKNLNNYEISYYIKTKIKKFEQKKMMSKLFAVDGNPKKIAFILNVNDSTAEDFKNCNSIFFKNDKLDLDKFEDIRLKWENELKIETAIRSVEYPIQIEKISEVFDFDKNELEKCYDDIDNHEGENYKIRNEIAEKLMESSHSRQTISEISGLGKFRITLMADSNYYNRFFDKYYDKYENEKPIKYQI